MFSSRFRNLARPLQHTRCRLSRDFTVAIDGPAASGKSSTARAVAQELGFGYIDSGSIYRCATLLALREGITSVEERVDDLADLIKRSTINMQIEPNGASRVPSLGAAGTAKSIVVPDVRVLLNGQDVSQEIRTAEVNKFVAKVASDGKVRAAVLDIQRSLAAKAETAPQHRQKSGGEAERIPGGVVMDGRDIGTTIFPNAELKIYLDASAMARAIRRWDQMNSQINEKNSNDVANSAGGSGSAEPPNAEYPSVEEIARELEERDYADINRKHSPLRIAPDAVVIDNTNLTFEQQVYTISDLARERMGLQPKHDDF